ncbi:MAG: polyphosphate kinase 1 [Planctomycetaceae bacterium]|nr:polyphosphate kinase 1 [Planctomycetaceae bacterium]
MFDIKTPEPDQLLNREMSWLEFNQRVLNQAQDTSNPLLERVKFLAITGSNLDEFFMVRIGSLQILIGSKHERPDVTGFRPQKLLQVAGDRVRRLMREQYDCFEKLQTTLRHHGIAQLDPEQWTRKQTVFLRHWFDENVVSVLSPVAIDLQQNFPLLNDSEMALAVQLDWQPEQMLGGDWKTDLSTLADDQRPSRRFAILPLGRKLDRFVNVPVDGGHGYVLLEAVVKKFVGEFFPGQAIRDCVAFRITRNADMRVDEDGAFDLLHGMQEILAERRESSCVRLEIESGADPATREFLMQCLQVDELHVFETAGPVRLKDWFRIASLPGFDGLRFDAWSPQESPHFSVDRNIFDVIRESDRILIHPYQVYDPVVRFIEAAADDPDVLAIKQTLYRTSSRSQIVQALQRAAQNQKHVTAIVELKARFDEERNIKWARSLETAGVNVIYGVRGLKTHSKICIVVRKDPDGLRHYCHIATGNYNEATATLYSDISYFTCNDVIGSDAINFFNAVTGMSIPQPMQKMSMAPLGLRQRILEMINVEVQNAASDAPSGIRLKVNSLVDPMIIGALYKASQAGVPVELNVRGICCLRPGVPGLSERITVTSIVDRYLEHSRIFYFHHGGDRRVFISSADMMARNLDRRIELLVPIEDESCRRRLLEVLDYYFQDNVKAKRLMPDGSYVPVPTSDQEFHCQKQLYRYAVQQRSEQFSAETSMFHPHRRDTELGIFS